LITAFLRAAKASLAIGVHSNEFFQSKKVKGATIKPYLL
jgi:hypothetical protein